MKRKERKKLDRKISEASGVAAYAINEAMTDEEALEAVQHLEVFSLLKSSVNKNRNTQKQLTIKGKEEARQEERERFKEFLDPQNSELLNIGRWLKSALSMKGTSRKSALKEKNLVHMEDHHESVDGLKGTIDDIVEVSAQTTKQSNRKTEILEKRVDDLRWQLNSLKKYIISNFGKQEWERMRDHALLKK
ncbi:MAG: hypothetical protein WBB82_03900 [Limnothrix sp.]